MKIKKVLILPLIILFLFLSVQVASAVSLIGEDLANRCASKEGCGLCDFIGLFVTGADILVGLSGTFAILMFVYGGLVLITAYGNDSRITWGKNILTATIIGILIVFFAWTLVNVIIGALFGHPNFEWFNTNGVCSEGVSGQSH
ncbi:MAG: hypothetical protein Q7K65_04185 [Candidatus Buchananbacteria bacterium]|nr:hypothetical protein [Candidatus Buchananbacteria bacterium]